MKFAVRTFAMSRDTSGHFYEVYEQPLRDKIIADLYHKWDMTTGKILIKFVDPVHRRMFGEREQYMPYSCKQDFRCYNLSMRNRKHLAQTPLVPEE